MAWIAWAHYEPFFPDAQRDKDSRTVRNNPPHKRDIVLGTIRVIEMCARGMNLTTGQALQCCSTVGREPVDPQASMPALSTAGPQRQGWRAPGDDERVRQRIDVL